MSENQTPSQDLRDEADESFVGPGVVATKSQTKGSLIGTLVGAVIGAIVGLAAGALIWDDNIALVIAVIAFAIAGATAGGTAGGFLRNRERMERGEPDV